jgi:hypothetical protein
MCQAYTELFLPFLAFLLCVLQKKKCRIFYNDLTFLPLYYMKLVGSIFLNTSSQSQDVNMGEIFQIVNNCLL